jgi:hypothetical protein
MVNWAARQNPCFDERDLYSRWICKAGFVQLDVQMLYSIKYCVQVGIGWYRLDLPSVGPRGAGLKALQTLGDAGHFSIFYDEIYVCYTGGYYVG